MAVNLLEMVLIMIFIAMPKELKKHKYLGIMK